MSGILLKLCRVQNVNRFPVKGWWWWGNGQIESSEKPEEGKLKNNIQFYDRYPSVTMSSLRSRAPIPRMRPGTRAGSWGANEWTSEWTETTGSKMFEDLFVAFMGFSIFVPWQRPPPHAASVHLQLLWLKMGNGGRWSEKAAFQIVAI